eukprot:TRINITY_DN7614_c2_g1_i1.p1 TRINITY_DN7614_c2_g1~~TRINITY_DN7614_c2_g1_i1.p1  ORF type:complete len:361 (+),score=85.77 TRINITY_DN7614_c2_g1_i1:68-1150(+)
MLLQLSLLSAAGAVVTVSNVVPKRDVNGSLMDVHDGNIMQWSPGGLYYWYGMGYGGCQHKKGILPPVDCPGIYRPFGGCGFQLNHSVNVYTSPDLLTWTFSGDVLPVSDRPEGVYFRPKVVFNGKNREWVLWINILEKKSSVETPLEAYPKAGYLVAASASPTGPFKVVTPSASMLHKGGGDFALLVDPASPSDAYIAYDAWSNSHTVTVEKLAPDFLDSARVSSGTVSPKGMEAPAMFVRSGWYYLTFGKTCCFCHQGSGVEVYAARSPLGPYTSLGTNIGRDADGRSISKAQQNFVASVNRTDGGVTYLWTGDRWESAPDNEKGHDLQYWYPLRFNDTQVPPAIEPLVWVDNFTLTVG